MSERLNLNDAQYEAMLVQEKARQIAEKFKKMAQELVDVKAQYKLEGVEFNSLGKLEKVLFGPLDASITQADYNEALKYVESLLNVPKNQVLKNWAANFKIAVLELSHLKRTRATKIKEKK